MKPFINNQFILIGCSLFFIFLNSCEVDKSTKIIDEDHRIIPVTEASESWLPIQTTNGYLSAVLGPYADADVLPLAGGGFRMYVGSMGVRNIVSFYSADGLVWSTEEGIRVSNAAFPDALHLSDGRVRIYFQGAGVIESAISSDGGLIFEKESGVRINNGWYDSLDIDQVGDGSTVGLDNGSFRMYYRGADEDSAYFNNMKTVILSATSQDGLNWTPEPGVRVAPEDWVEPHAPNNTRFVTSPEAVMTSSGNVKLYFWGVGMCHGVCLSVSADGLNFNVVEQVYANADSPGGNNIGDPSILPLENKPWLMFYGNGSGVDYGIWIAKRQ